MKLMIYVGAFVGSIVGSWLPVVLLHQGWLSGAAIIGGFVGMGVGIWAGWKAGDWIDL
jgi:hypothetical protein